MKFTWKILELFADNDKLTSVRYLLSLTDGSITVNTEGNQIFSDGLVNKTLSETTEANIMEWLEKDTTIDDINPIKLGLENQLKSLKIGQKVDFPWLAGTFTIE